MKLAFLLLAVFACAWAGPTKIDLPSIGDAIDLVSAHTGHDYDGDGNVEIVALFREGKKGDFRVGLYSVLKFTYIYTSKGFKNDPVVISGDFNGDGQADIMIDRAIICFPKP